MWKLLVGNPSCWVTSGKPLCLINPIWEKKRAVITIKLASPKGLLKQGLCEDKLVIFIVIIGPPGAFWRILSDLPGSCPMDMHEMRWEGTSGRVGVVSVTGLTAVHQGWPQIYPQMFKLFLNIVTLLVWCRFLFLRKLGKQAALQDFNAHFSLWKTR